MPAGSKANENSPDEPEAAIRVIPFSELVSFMDAFGTLAPEGSETEPDKAAVELNVCARSVGMNVSPQTIAAIKTTQ